MGYYTDYELTVTPCEKWKAYAELHGGDEEAVVHEFEQASFEDCVKWYNMHEDMINLSKNFPDTLFQIDGYGEEAGDMTRTFFMGGKSMKAALSFEPFDKSKLT